MSRRAPTLLLAVSLAVLASCLAPARAPTYVRWSGLAYTWRDVPPYHGRVVNFSRWGEPMIDEEGWHYIPDSDPAYQQYRAYGRRVELCHSRVRDERFSRYCTDRGLLQRQYVSNTSSTCVRCRLEK